MVLELADLTDLVGAEEFKIKGFPRTVYIPEIGWKRSDPWITTVT